MRHYLVELRNKSGETQAQVAHRMGIANSYYSMIENGVRQKRMNADTIEKLAAAFGVSVEYIFQQERQRAG